MMIHDLPDLPIRIKACLDTLESSTHLQHNSIFAYAYTDLIHLLELYLDLAQKYTVSISTFEYQLIYQSDLNAEEIVSFAITNKIVGG